MAITKIQSESLNLADTYAFTGTVTGAGEANKPAFAVKLSSAQGTNADTDTKLQWGTEIFDTDNCFDSSTNYRFTPTKAGKYFLYFKCGYQSDFNHRQMRVMIYKNGSNVAEKNIFLINEELDNFSSNLHFEVSAVVEANGSSDYFEAYARMDYTGAILANTQHTQFGGYLIST